MELYLLRHGQAEPSAASGRDADRRLTAEGQSEVRRVARRLAMMGAAPTVILSSPYLRAVETAQIAGEVLGYEGEIVPAHCLVPDSSPGEVWTELRGFADDALILAVGHEPLLSTTLSWILGVTQGLSPFPTAGLARVDLNGRMAVPDATMRFLIGPNSA